MLKEYTVELKKFHRLAYLFGSKEITLAFVFFKSIPEYLPIFAPISKHNLGLCLFNFSMSSVSLFFPTLANGCLGFCSGRVWTGEDANADITIAMSDADMIAWWEKTLDWQDAFWRGQMYHGLPMDNMDG